MIVGVIMDDLDFAVPPEHAWRLQASCREIAPELFSSDSCYVVPKEIRSVCGACPVRRECLTYALEQEGSMYRGCRACIYGGYTPSQRHKIYKDKVKQGLTYKGIADKVIDEEELKVGTTHEVDTKDIYADTLAKVG